MRAPRFAVWRHRPPVVGIGSVWLPVHILYWNDWDFSQGISISPANAVRHREQDVARRYRIRTARLRVLSDGRTGRGQP